jgi:hypothetical protein
MNLLAVIPAKAASPPAPLQKRGEKPPPKTLYYIVFFRGMFKGISGFPKWKLEDF